MKVKIEFECEIYPEKFTPWLTVNDEIQCTNLECMENLKVFYAETGKEIYWLIDGGF